MSAQVLRRCYATMIPTSTDYLATHLNPPDLYGPFWTLSTRKRSCFVKFPTHSDDILVIFALFLSSSLGASIASYLSEPGSAYDYDFQLLSVAVSIVYAYGIVLPVLLWLALRYLGVGEWSVVRPLFRVHYSNHSSVSG